MQEGNRSQRREQMMSAAPMISQHSPGLELCDHVFDPGTTATMAPPRAISEDAIAMKGGRDQLRHTAVATISKHSSMVLAHRLDGGATIVERVVAIAGTTTCDGNEPQVAVSYKNLRVA